MLPLAASLSLGLCFWTMIIYYSILTKVKYLASFYASFGGAMDYEEAAMLYRDLRLVGRSFNDALNTIGSVVGEVKSVKRLAGGSKSGDLGSKLIAAGMACVIFPEPIISDIAGSMLIATGMLIKSRRGPTLTDVFRETRRVMSMLRDVNMML
ncbi:MAG: hypothetical protein QW305_06655 [Candidatus Bathyarchaeia archaeon]